MSTRSLDGRRPCLSSNLRAAYQGFVDLLTTHGKESSSAFLQLYTSLSEAPDPFPLLEASVEALVVSEDTLPRLTQENADLQKRAQKLSQELETTESRLQTERQARQELEHGSGKKADNIESSWRQAMEEKETNWAMKEKMLEEKLENQERLFKELKANHEVSQRLGKDEQDSLAQKAASAELQLVVSDLERTSARLAEVEARNEQLRVELARSTAQATNSQDEDPQVLRLQSENSSLLRRLESIRFDREGEKRKLEEQAKQLERQRRSAMDESQDLRKRLQKWSDYDEVKRELDMLKSIELSAEDEDEDNTATEAHATNGTSSDANKNTLEKLLLSRNKKLSEDLTILRVSHKELVQQLDEVQEELSQNKKDLDASQTLSTRLENDLSQLQEEAASGLPSSGMSVAGTYVSRYPQSIRRGRSSPTSSIISGFDGQSRGSIAADAGGGGSGILPMVQAQRDRFKQKTQQLEEELQKTYATVTSLRQEVASLQKDNLSLYEKSRYVAAYNRGDATSSAYGRTPSHTSIGAVEEAAGDRWKSQYEANISPFAAFRGREAARAYKRMNVAERMVFSLTRIVLATRTSRNLFAGYCLALHLLVFLMLYWTSAASAASGHLDGTVPVAGVGGAAALAKDAVPHAADWHKEEFG